MNSLARSLCAYLSSRNNDIAGYWGIGVLCSASIDGAIETKNPDEATVKKMVQIAEKLKARVIGEEDEEYGPDGKQRAWAQG